MMFLDCGCREGKHGTGRRQRCSQYFLPGTLPQSQFSLSTLKMNWAISCCPSPPNSPPFSWSHLNDLGGQCYKGSFSSLRMCAPSFVLWDLSWAPGSCITSSRQFSNWLSKALRTKGGGAQIWGLSDPLTVSNQDTIHNGFSMANYSHE